MIGNLPGTLADRSVAIALKRKRPDEAVENFRYERTEELDQLARMCARWAIDNLGRLRRADVGEPRRQRERGCFSDKQPAGKPSARRHVEEHERGPRYYEGAEAGDTNRHRRAGNIS
jgi:hypothetical protein